MSFCVFISSTSELEAYRKAAVEVVKELGLVPKIDAESMDSMRTQTSSIMDTCKEFVQRGHLLLLIVGFKRGSQPSKERGGDGVKSYTWYEWEWARDRGIPVRAFLGSPHSWSLSRELMYEGDEEEAWVERFRREIDRAAVQFALEKDTGLPKFRSEVEEAVKAHYRELDGYASSLRAASEFSWLDVGVQNRLLDLARRYNCLVYDKRRIERLYREHLPTAYAYEPEWQLNPSDHSPKILSLAAGNLARFPNPEDSTSHPLKRFIDGLGQDGLALHTDSTVALSQAPAEWRLSTVAPQPVGPYCPVSTSTRRIVRVLIRIEKSKLDEDGRLVRVWLLEANKFQKCNIAKEQWGIHDRSIELSKIYNDVRNLHTDAELFVEFILDRSLIDDAVEDWEIEADGREGLTKLGILEPVVIRGSAWCRPRAYAETRWKTSMSGAQTPLQMHNLSTDQPPDALSAVYIEKSKIDGPTLRKLVGWWRVPCAILQMPPPTPDENKPATATDILSQLLDATGIPVLVWPHRKSSWARGDSTKLLCELVQNRPLADIPHAVRTERIALAHKPSPVALFWNDPTQPLPEDARKKSPLHLEIRG